MKIVEQIMNRTLSKSNQSEQSKVDCLSLER